MLAFLSPGGVLCLPAMADPPQASPADMTFAHYRVELRPDSLPWELGRGAMGVTYKAYDSQLRVHVALKVINPAQVGDAKTQALFLREARAAARVHHGNVANVVFLNQDPANPFYAMEFIAGESLRDWLPTRCPLPPLLAIGLAEQIARGLEAIHAENVVHRDLKPGNVMIVRTPRGRENGASETDPAMWQVKIIDFGLARAFAGDALSSNLDALTTGFRGTAVYASPEQCQERVDLDGRSDLYSLGCILWEMLVGAPPFRGSSLQEILTLHVSRPAPVALLSRLPASLQAVVARLLVKEPEGRFSHAAAVVEALGRCREKILVGVEGADGSGPASQLETALVAPAQTGARNRAVLFALGGVALAGILFFTGRFAGWWQRSPPLTGKTPPLMVTVPTSAPAPAPAASIRPDKSIAVLPFENLSSDKENAFFADGVQDQILTDLSRIADLRVTSRTSVMRYRALGDRSMREIAKELGVVYILEGTVQRAGNKVRVTAQLIDTRTDAHVWAEKYDRDLADVFGIQSEVATAIAGQLKAKLTVAERAAIEERPTNDLAAYDLYLRARALEQTETDMMLPQTPETPRQVARLLDEAVSRDPKFLQAYSMAVGVNDWIAATSRGDESKDYRARAEASLATAVRLAPDAGETLLAQANHAYLALTDRRAAREWLGKALVALPNNAEAWALLGAINRDDGRWDESLDCFRRAHVLSPNDLKIIEPYSYLATWMRLYDLRKALCARGAALTVGPQRWAYEIRSAATEGHRSGDGRPIRAVLDRILAENPGSRTEQELGQHPFLIAASVGDVAKMERLANLFPPPTTFGTRLDAADRQIMIGQVRRDPDAVRRAVEAIVPEIESRLQSQAGKKTYANAGLTLRVGYLNALVGKKEEAVRAVRTAGELMPDDLDEPSRLSIRAEQAKIFALTGENALALDELEYLTSRPSGMVLKYGDLLEDADWIALRGEPRFQAVLAKLGPGGKK